MTTRSGCDCGSSRPTATHLLCAHQIDGEWNWQGAQQANDPVCYAWRTCVDDDPHGSLLTGGLQEAVARAGSRCSRGCRLRSDAGTPSSAGHLRLQELHIGLCYCGHGRGEAQDKAAAVGKGNGDHGFQIGAAGFMAGEFGYGEMVPVAECHEVGDPAFQPSHGLGIGAGATIEEAKHQPVPKGAQRTPPCSSAASSQPVSGVTANSVTGAPVGHFTARGSAIWSISEKITAPEE